MSAHPLAGLRGLPDVLDVPVAVCTAGAVVAAVASLAVRYRSSGEEVRRRLQWVLAAALLTVALAGVALAAPRGAGGATPRTPSGSRASTPATGARARSHTTTRRR